MNRSKQDSDYDSFNVSIYSNKKINTPLNQFNHHDCKYAADWIAIKHRYNLTITQQEKNALENIINICPDDIIPSYPVLQSDNLGKSIDIIQKNKEILLYPLNEKQSILIRDQLKQKWKDRCSHDTRNFPKEELIRDIQQNAESLGVHNIKYVNQKNNLDNNANYLCNIVLADN